MSVDQTQPIDEDARIRSHPLQPVRDRVLWLATAMIDHANHGGRDNSGLKVGGHQASSASMVSIMTSLWFEHLRREDLVSVKPHASPVLHAINYLLGQLDPAALTTLRQFGGLQSYPSRSKDPDPVDFSTGSVGIGATAPIWAAIARRYLDDRVPVAPPRGRQYSLLGDAELDEGACWEAVLDPVVSRLGEVVWIVDLNRQSLDRVLPGPSSPRAPQLFEAAGWQVLTAKYGGLLSALFEMEGGELLRDRIDGMGNAEYQRMLRCQPEALRERLAAGDPRLADVLTGLPDDVLHRAVRNLGGHDLETLDRVFREIDDDRPTIIFAYTIKGFGLPIEGHPQNHSALLTASQLGDLAATLGVNAEEPWTAFPAGSPLGRLCADTADRLKRDRPPSIPMPDVPSDLHQPVKGVTSTQAALGRTLLDLVRAAPEVGQRLVTASPDVSSSTNLGGWVNKVGVWNPSDEPDWFADDADTVLHWREGPQGQHIELGIAETNLVGLIAELGTTWQRWGQPLVPIGVLYDPFVERALEPWSFGIYAGGQSILVGTPAGVTLAAEGGAHQSIKTPSIGLEQPGCISWEPAFAVDLAWILLEAIRNVGRPGGASAYLRLSTRPMDQTLAQVSADTAARTRRRRQVVGGAYPLRRAKRGPVNLTLCAQGPLVVEALSAADRLTSLGFAVDVVCVTSPGMLFDALQARRGLAEGSEWIIDSAFPASRAAPMITVLDGHPHALAFLAGIHQQSATHLGVTRFGQSGDLQSVYRYHGLDAESIIGSALDLID